MNAERQEEYKGCNMTIEQQKDKLRKAAILGSTLLLGAFGLGYHTTHREPMTPEFESHYAPIMTNGNQIIAQETYAFSQAQAFASKLKQTKPLNPQNTIDKRVQDSITTFLQTPTDQANLTHRFEDVVSTYNTRTAHEVDEYNTRINYLFGFGFAIGALIIAGSYRQDMNSIKQIEGIHEMQTRPDEVLDNCKTTGRK